MATALICDPNSSFFGMMGITAAVVFSNLGGSYGTAKCSVGLSSMGVMRPDLVIRGIVPIVLAGVLGIYGLILGIIMLQKMNAPATYSAFAGYVHLGAGLCCGLSSLAAGLAIGIVGDAGVRAIAQQPKLYIGLLLMLIFAEVLAVYGLIMGILINNTTIPDDLCQSYAIA